MQIKSINPKTLLTTSTAVNFSGSGRLSMKVILLKVATQIPDIVQMAQTAQATLNSRKSAELCRMKKP